MEEHIVYDKEGAEIKLPGSPEEISKALEDGKTAAEIATTAAEESKTKIEELTTSTQELTDKLEKESGKVGNWKDLRTKAEAGDIKLSETEKLLLQKQEELEKANEDKGKSGDDRLLNNWKDKAINNLVKEDAELEKKVLDAYGILGIEAKNEREVAEKMETAYLVATGKTVEKDAVLSAAGAVHLGGAPQQTKGKDIPDDVKDLAKRLDPSLSEDDFKTK